MGTYRSSSPRHGPGSATRWRALAAQRPARGLFHASGATTVLEFAILAPTFFLFLFSVLGAGLDGLFQMTLDDSARYAARQIQIDGPAATSSAQFVHAVCSEYAIISLSCNSILTFSVQASTAQAGFTAITPTVLSSSGRYGGAFYATGSFGDNVNVLVQVAVPLPFTLPYVSSLITGTGTTSITATTAVRVEPF